MTPVVQISNFCQYLTSPRTPRSSGTRWLSLSRARRVDIVPVASEVMPKSANFQVFNNAEYKPIRDQLQIRRVTLYGIISVYIRDHGYCRRQWWFSVGFGQICLINRSRPDMLEYGLEINKTGNGSQYNFINRSRPELRISKRDPNEYNRIFIKHSSKRTERSIDNRPIGIESKWRAVSQ